MGSGSRGFWLLAGAVVITIAAVWWFAHTPDGGSGAAGGSAMRAEPIRVERGRAVVASAPTANVSASVASAPEAPADGPPPNMTPPDPAEMRGIGAVNLEEVRKAMPDNLYWKLSAPTKDPQVQKERDAERARWNVEYGKILSGTASEDEIRSYYDYRARLSGDYIEFATYLVENYKDILSDQDLTLLHLALRLNRARLEEIPHQIEVAFERKAKQDAARAAWQADQAAFGAADSNSK